MNEHELANLFAPHKVCSARILRDKSGHGRGVGFARFDSRDSCEEVIKTFNNHTIHANGEDLQIQIRYADTHEQKVLKQQTQAARQFRSAEYEYATQAWRQGRLPYAGTTVHEASSATGNEFDQYLGTTANIPIQGQRWAQSAIRTPRGEVAQAPYNTNTNQSAAQTDATAGAENNAPPIGKDSEIDTKPVVTASNDAVASPVDSAAASE